MGATGYKGVQIIIKFQDLLILFSVLQLYRVVNFISSNTFTNYIAHLNQTNLSRIRIPQRCITKIFKIFGSCFVHYSEGHVFITFTPSF